MIILAHDGSLYGDWVARYALQFATEEGDRKLLVLHVLDGKITREVVTAKLAQLEADCQALDIEMLQELLPLGSNVYRSLRQATPHDPDALLICGTRVKARKSAFLRGSVAEQLLRSSATRPARCAAGAAAAARRSPDRIRPHLAEFPPAGAETAPRSPVSQPQYPPPAPPSPESGP